jgi:hypothetical protein
MKKYIKEQYELTTIKGGEVNISLPDLEMNMMDQMIPVTATEVMAAYIGFTRAFHLWFHAAHNVTKGTGFAGDHTSLYGPIYVGVQDTIDRVIEKAIGIFDDEELGCPMRITSDAMLVLEEWESPTNQSADRIADIALAYCKQFVTMDEAVASTLDEMGSLTFGLDNLLAELADVHESYVYLLQQRSK